MVTSFIIRKWVGLEAQGAPIEISINTFSTSIPPENIRKPEVFWGYRRGTLVENG